MFYGQMIKGRTVLLRSICEDDAEATFKMRWDPVKSQYIHGARGTVEDQRRFIQRQMSAEGDWLFVIEDLRGRPIGMKGLYDYRPEIGQIESGRFMNFGTQVQGIEALCLGFDFAFDVLNVQLVVMSALENNHNMLGIQRRIGARVVDARHNEDFGCRSIYSVLDRDSYAGHRNDVSRLIDRFAGR